MPAGTIVYVHGTGDRMSNGLADHEKALNAGIANLKRDFGVVVCEWGDKHGTRLDGMADSMPDEDSSVRASRNYWRRLRRNPVLPLTEPGATMSASTHSPSMALMVTLSDFLLGTAVNGGFDASSLRDEERAGYPGSRITREVARAAKIVRSSQEYKDACEANEKLDVYDRTARAVSALAADRILTTSKVSRSWSHTSEEKRFRTLVSALELKLGLRDYLALGVIGAGLMMKDRDVPDWLGRWATDTLQPIRRDFMTKEILGFTDILLYQRHGGRIRAYVAEKLRLARRSGDKVVALGNSLGGIILADLLSQQAEPDCDLFITTGSQPGALMTFEALGHAATKRPFQPWLNIYDPRDFMGFRAENVWKHETNIKDEPVNLERGFPHSHGVSYYKNDAVFKMMFKYIDKL